MGKWFDFSSSDKAVESLRRIVKQGSDAVNETAQQVKQKTQEQFKNMDFDKTAAELKEKAQSTAEQVKSFSSEQFKRMQDALNQADSSAHASEQTSSSNKGDSYTSEHSQNAQAQEERASRSAHQAKDSEHSAEYAQSTNAQHTQSRDGKDTADNREHSSQQHTSGGDFTAASQASSFDFESWRRKVKESSDFLSERAQQFRQKAQEHLKDIDLDKTAAELKEKAHSTAEQVKSFSSEQFKRVQDAFNSAPSAPEAKNADKVATEHETHSAEHTSDVTSESKASSNSSKVSETAAFRTSSSAFKTGHEEHTTTYSNQTFSTAHEQELSKRAAVRDLLERFNFSYLYLLARFNIYVLAVLEEDRVLAVHPYPIGLGLLDRDRDIITYPQDLYILKAKGQSSIGDNTEVNYSFMVVVPQDLPDEMIAKVSGAHHAMYKDKERLLTFLANYLQRALQVVLGRFDLERELHRREKLSEHGPFEFMSFEEYYFAQMPHEDVACFFDSDSVVFGSKIELKERFVTACDYSPTAHMTREVSRVQIVERDDIEWQQIKYMLKVPFYFIPSNTILNELELEVILYIASIDMKHHNTRNALAAYHMLLRLSDHATLSQVHLRLASCFCEGYLSYVEPIRGMQHALKAFKLMGSRAQNEREIFERAAAGRLEEGEIILLLQRDYEQHGRISGLVKAVVAINLMQRAHNLGLGKRLAQAEFDILLQANQPFINKALERMSLDLVALREKDESEHITRSSEQELALAQEWKFFMSLPQTLGKEYGLNYSQVCFFRLMLFALLVREYKLHKVGFTLPSLHDYAL